MRITVLGLGNMGTSIARRLLATGHNVTVWNRTTSKSEALARDGARSASDLGAAAADADAVLISVRDDDAAADVLRSLASADLGCPVVNCTTSAPDRTTRLAALVPKYVASPILGAPQAVADGTAGYLVAGPRDAIEALAPVWSALTSNLRLCGDDPARASILKLVSNHLLLTGLVALSEAVAVGQATGLPDELLQDFLSSSAMVPAGLQNRLADVIGSDHTEGWFAVPLGAKDLGLFTDLGGAHGVVPPLAGLAGQRYATAAERGLADVDVAAVVELLRDLD